MKKTCSVLDTRQRLLPLSVANIKTQLVQNISPGSKKQEHKASGPSSSLATAAATSTTRVNSRDAATMLHGEEDTSDWREKNWLRGCLSPLKAAPFRVGTGSETEWEPRTPPETEA